MSYPKKNTDPSPEEKPFRSGEKGFAVFLASIWRLFLLSVYETVSKISRSGFLRGSSAFCDGSHRGVRTDYTSDR